MKPPTTNLQPGDTGAEVKKLQDYLVSQGLMTRAQVDTGYGIYGPQTTQAVKTLQERLGVDNSSGVGYFGPKTRSAIGSSETKDSPSAPTKTDATTNTELATILNNPGLTDDQKTAIQTIHDTVVSNDIETASKVKAAMVAASEFSDPYFKAQIRLATDALERGISGKEGDLAFAERQQKATLEELRVNTAASRELLSFNHAQELKNLETKYTTDLENTQQNLAATGFTTSSRRTRAEQILGEQNQGLVESSNKTYGYQTGNLDRTLSANEASTQAQIENLRRITAEGKLDLFRRTEGQVGTGNLPALSGFAPLGGIGGDIPRTQTTDQLSFANNFVF